MAGVVTITISANNYSAYNSVALADIYLAVDPVRAAPWATKNTDGKGGLLVAATRRIDLFTFPGEKTGGEAQTTQWPRTGVSYADGTPVPDDTIPQDIIDATTLLAGTMASTPAAAQAGSSGSNKKRLKAGSAEIEYFRPTDGVPLQDETAYALLKNWLASASGVTSTTASLGALASGTCERSRFCETDMGFGLQEGYP